MIETQYLAWLVKACGYQNAKLLPGGRWAATYTFKYSDDVIAGSVADRASYDSRWCYATPGEAAAALAAWQGVGEPQGWWRRIGTAFPQRVPRTCQDRSWHPVGTPPRVGQPL